MGRWMQVGLIVFTLAAGSIFAAPTRAAERETQSYPTTGVPLIFVSHTVNPVRLVAGDDSVVKVEATAGAFTVKTLNVATSGNLFTVNSDNNNAGEIVVTAPAGSTLRVSGTTGTQRASGFVGDTSLTTNSGAIIGDGLRGNVVARSVSGAITLTNIDAVFSAQNGSGAVAVSGTLRGGSRANTQTGPITLTLSRDTSVAVHAYTASSRITNDFDLIVGHGYLNGDSVDANIGGGSSGRLDLTSGSGAIMLKRAM